MAKFWRFITGLVLVGATVGAGLGAVVLGAAPAGAATDSISAVVQVCTLPIGTSCDPTQPLNGSDWAASTTVYGSEVWWRVVITNTSPSPDAISNITVTSSLPAPPGPNGTDCYGSVPVPGNSLAAGASYGYVCQTNPVTPVPSTVTQTVSASGTGPAAGRHLPDFCPGDRNGATEYPAARSLHLRGAPDLHDAHR